MGSLDSGGQFHPSFAAHALYGIGFSVESSGACFSMHMLGG